MKKGVDLRSLGPRATEKEKEAARKELSALGEKLKEMEELWEVDRMELIEWYKEEREYAEATALEDLRRAGEELPAETEEEAAAAAAAGRAQEQARWKVTLNRIKIREERGHRREIARALFDYPLILNGLHGIRERWRDGYGMGRVQYDSGKQLTAADES